MVSARVITLNITLGSYSKVLDDIILLGKSNTPSYVCFANVHMTVEAARKPLVRQAISAANIITADGMPIAKAIRYKYGIQQDRVAGMDAMPDLLGLASSHKLSVFFFGSTESILDAIKNKALLDFPELKIAGMLSPPFDRNMEELNEDYIRTINASNANLVMVALGCPKQELWMSKYSARINATLLGVGGAFPVYAGSVARAPAWMQRSSLEWLYRLGKEPFRLFGRYFLTNSYFLFRIFFEIIGYRLGIKRN